MTFLSKRIYRPNGDYPFGQGAYIVEVLSLGSIKRRFPKLWAKSAVQRGRN
jgi:hypothetical protein